MAAPSFGAALVVGFVWVSPAFAQERGPGDGVETNYAAGVVWQRGIFGDDDPETRSAPGIILGLQVRDRTAGRTSASIELSFQPIGLANPHFDEALHTLYVLAGAQIGRRLYVRPAGGIALQMWTGSRTESAFSFALAAGFAVGWRDQSRHGRFHPELVVRCSASPGAISTLIGVQIAIGDGG
jgi:hypothetical protein